MFDVNRVHLGGRITAIMNKKTKNDDDYIVIGIVMNKKNGEKTSATFVNVMVFNEILVRYINSLEIGKGYFCLIDGYLSNIRIGKVPNAICVIANDVNVVMKTVNDKDIPTTENAIMEDFNDLDLF